MYYIYKHENLINGKVYIGQTCQKPEYRWKNGNGYKRQPKFYNAIKKYGWDNFTHEILYSSEYEGNIDWMEKMFINEYHSADPECGYNLESGGSLNKHLSDETKKKLSEYHKGKKLSDEQKRKISESHKGNKNRLGTHHSDETKKKLSESNKGKKYRLGTHHSDETKKKIGLSNSKSILQYSKDGEFTKEWNSTMEIQRELGLNNSSISKVCLGKLKTCGGFIWRYKDE